MCASWNYVIIFLTLGWRSLPSILHLYQLLYLQIKSQEQVILNEHLKLVILFVSKRRNDHCN